MYQHWVCTPVPLLPRREHDIDIAVRPLGKVGLATHFRVAGRQREGEDLQHAPDAPGLGLGSGLGLGWG